MASIIKRKYKGKKGEITTNINARNNDDIIKLAKEKINNIFRQCCRNVVEKPKNKKSNILPFCQKSYMLCFLSGGRYKTVLRCSH